MICECAKVTLIAGIRGQFAVASVIPLTTDASQHFDVRPQVFDNVRHGCTVLGCDSRASVTGKRAGVTLVSEWLTTSSARSRNLVGLANCINDSRRTLSSTY